MVQMSKFKSSQGKRFAYKVDYDKVHPLEMQRTYKVEQWNIEILQKRLRWELVNANLDPHLIIY